VNSPLMLIVLLLASTAPGHARAGDLLIRNARVYTLSEPPVLAAADIYIKDGKIEDIKCMARGCSSNGYPPDR